MAAGLYQRRRPARGRVRLRPDPRAPLLGALRGCHADRQVASKRAASPPHQIGAIASTSISQLGRASAVTPTRVEAGPFLGRTPPGSVAAASSAGEQIGLTALAGRA